MELGLVTSMNRMRVHSDVGFFYFCWFLI